MALEPFKTATALTMGVELELQLVSLTDFDLLPCAGDVKPEITESMIEVATDVHTRYDELLAQLQQIRDALVAAGDKLNVGLCGGGTHPFQHWSDRRIFAKPRFKELSWLYGYLAKQFTVFGQHVLLTAFHCAIGVVAFFAGDGYPVRFGKAQFRVCFSA